MNVIETKIPGVVVLEPRVFGDERGFFMETWNQARYEEAGLPARFVHGFVVTGEDAPFSYKRTDYHAPEHDGSILWNDPEMGIRWPVENPTLSGKDASAPPLSGLPEGSPAANPTG